MKDRVTASLYVGVLMVALLSLFGLIWVYTATQRVRFLPEESAAWRARIQMINHCDTGTIAVLGSSRASAAFLPKILGSDVTNLSMSGITPVEVYYEIAKIYMCPKPPRVVVLSFAPLDWVSSEWFWARSARYGLLSYSDLVDAAKNAAAVHDTVLYHGSFGSEPPPAMKNLLYAAHFPPYDFASLLAAGTGRRRYRENVKLERETLVNRGEHLMYDNGNICIKMAGMLPELEERREAFLPRPINVEYAQKLLSFLEARGVKVLFVAAPTSTWEQRYYSAAFLKGYSAFIQYLQKSHSNFDVIGPLIPLQSPCDFADIYHVNQVGAEKFSRRVKPMIIASLSH